MTSATSLNGIRAESTPTHPKTSKITTLSMRRRGDKTMNAELDDRGIVTIDLLNLNELSSITKLPPWEKEVAKRRVRTGRRKVRCHGMSKLLYNSNRYVYCILYAHTYAYKHVKKRLVYTLCRAYHQWYISFMAICHTYSSYLQVKMDTGQYATVFVGNYKSISHHGDNSIVFPKKFKKAILMRGVQGIWGSQILDFFYT